MLAYLIIVEVMVLLLLAFVLMRSSRTVDLDHLVRERFAMLSLGGAVESGRQGGWSRLARRIEDVLVRAGIRHDGKRLRIVIAAGVLGVLLVTFRHGIGAGFLALAGATLLAYGFLQFRFRKRAEALLAQLPLFIDNLERSLGAGRSLLAALAQACERANEPLRGVLLRVRNHVELGGNLGEQLQAAANTMAVKEFQLLALTVNVHQRYGGSIKELLHSITVMVRQHEQARREFAALTGETRFSAWVLGVLPLLVGGYMALVNPGYVESMWASEAGRTLLYTALGFQATGAMLLWRMVKSI